jgi:hypothetical protein
MKALADLILANREQLAERVMALHFEQDPKLPGRYTAYQREMYKADTGHNLDALAAALILEMPETFADYVTWLHRLLTARNIPTAGLPMHFECMEQALREVLPENGWVVVGRYIQAGTRALSQPEQSAAPEKRVVTHKSQ